MFRRNRWIAAIMSAALVVTMAPAGVIAAEDSGALQAEVQENEVQEESSENTNEDNASAEGEENSDVKESSETPDIEEGAEGNQEEAVEAEKTDSEQTALDETDSQEADAAQNENSAGEEEAETTTDASEEEQEKTQEAADAGTEAVTQGEETEAAEQDKEKKAPANLTIQEITPEMAETDGDGVDPDEKYEAFLNSAFYGKKASGKRMLKASGMFKNKLTPTETLIYEKLVEAAKEISRGERDTGSVDIPITDITGGKTAFTAEELGLDYIIDEAGQWNPEIDAKLMEKYPIDYSMIQNILIAECPYEMFPLTGGVSHPVGFAYGAAYDGESWLLTLNEKFTVSLVPNANFAAGSGDKFAIDVEKIQNVLYAADTAKKIVSNAEGMSDYYKLCYYKEQICDLVQYDEAARDAGMDYEDRGAWSLLNVFDGKTSTNVVCEGYSEAFQYLCDLTDFNGDTYAYSVTGDMFGGTGGGGAHKWNIVHIEGENYIADITNSDGNSIGYDGKLFLAGMTGSVDEGYTKEWPGREEEQGDGSIKIYPSGSISYTYDSDTRNIYTDEQLTLSGHDYGTPEQDSADDKASLKGMSIYLTDKIGMRVYVKPVNGYVLSADDSLVFTCNGETKTMKVSEARKKTITDYNGDKIDVYEFGFGLWTKQMTDEVSFHVVVKGVPGTDKTYSVRSYADEILRGDYSDDEKAMVRAMLNYGGYAQKCFDYNTDNLANIGIFDASDDPVALEDPDLSNYAYKMEHAEDTKGFKLKQASLALGTDVSLIYSFKLEEGKKVSDYEFKVEGTDKKPVIGYSDYFKTDCVMIENITPNELNQMYTLTVTPKGESASVYTLTYGPFSYCKSKIAKGGESVKNLCKSIYYYWEAASKLK